MAASLSWDPLTSLALTHLNSDSCTCNGFAPSTGRRCGWRLEGYDISNARRILNDMAYLDPHGHDVQSFLPRLASLVLCQKHHQYQISEQVSGFTRRLKSVMVTSTPHMQIYSDQEAWSINTAPASSPNITMQRTSTTVNARTHLAQDKPKPSYDDEEQAKPKADANIAYVLEEFKKMVSYKADLERQVKATHALLDEEKDKSKKLQTETDQLEKTVTKLEANTISHERDRKEIQRLRSDNTKLRQANEDLEKSEAAAMKEIRDLEAQISLMTITPPSSGDASITLVDPPSMSPPPSAQAPKSKNDNVGSLPGPKKLSIFGGLGRVTRSKAAKKQPA